MQPKSLFLIIVFGVLILIGQSTLYIVKETERAVLLKFGEVAEADVKPGLHFKIPIMNKVSLIRGF